MGISVPSCRDPKLPSPLKRDDITQPATLLGRTAALDYEPRTAGSIFPVGQTEISYVLEDHQREDALLSHRLAVRRSHVYLEIGPSDLANASMSVRANALNFPQVDYPC